MCCSPTLKKYHSLEKNDRCWCGSPDAETYSQYGTGTCNYECGGSSTQMCGGYDSISLFVIVTGNDADDDVEDGAPVIVSGSGEFLYFFFSVRSNVVRKRNVLSSSVGWVASGFSVRNVFFSFYSW